MPRKTIVLAHGVLGFGNLVPGPGFINYFNGVALHLRHRGHTVIAPQVNPIGSVAQRGAQLAAAIVAQAPRDERVHILAHSMGGLDAREAITRVPGFSDRVATLVTIGTPHRGSPVADAIANRTDPLFSQIPPPLIHQLEHNAGALQNLTTEVCQRFDDNTPDVAGITYREVAGDASLGGHELFLFSLAEAIGRLKGEANDGVVSRSSALRNHPLDVWPFDHAGEIGWSVRSPLPILVELPLIAPPHLARYDDIVAIL
jgi:triacylglycerol lipase